MDSSTSSIVSALGGGSGIDMGKLAGDLAQARFAAQVKQLETRSELMETRISAASTLKSQLSQLASALGDRIRSGDLAPTATATNPGIATATLAPGSAPRGSYSLEVNSLAASQTLAGKSYAAADSLVGAGSLTFTFGTVAGTGFTADANRGPVSVAVTAQDTLATLADKISASGSGISAYVATGPAGAQLVMKGADGAASGFTVTGAGASHSGTDIFGRPRPANPGNINFLDWHPASDSGQLKQTARDAAFQLDGIAMTSPTNKVSGLANGLTLTLTGTNPGAPTQIAFATRDKDISGLMKDLTGALNEIVGALGESANPLGGELGNDAGARALKRSLSALAGTVVMPQAAAGEPRTLADLGLVLGRDGTFRLDEARLDKALADAPAATGAMFTTGFHGVYAALDKLSRAIGNSGDPGSLGGSITRYTKAKAEIAERLSAVAEKQEALRAQLAKSFTWADRDISASQSTLSFLKNQVALWNAPRD